MSDINIGAISEVLNDKLDRNLRNTKSPARTIVQTYSDDVGNWYEVYSDGWLSQGGRIASHQANTSIQSITLIKPMANTNYYANIIVNAGAFGSAQANLTVKIDDTTVLHYTANDGTGNELVWYVCGQGA